VSLFRGVHSACCLPVGDLGIAKVKIARLSLALCGRGPILHVVHH
jgi:hypothetical protein